MTRQPPTPDRENDEIVDLDALFEEIVLSDEESEREFLRTQWIERILNQLVSLRVSHHLTQRQLGERIGKPQSSVARIESAADMKLSVLWDYLSGIGLSPDVPLQVKALDDELESLRRYSAGGSAGLPRMPKYAFHRSAVAKARASAERGRLGTEEAEQEVPAPATTADTIQTDRNADASDVAA